MSVLAEPRLDEQVEAFLAGDPCLLADPFGLFRRLREAAPVYRHGALTILTRYDDVKRVYFDGVNFSKKTRSAGVAAAARAELREDLRPAWDEIANFGARMMTHLDGDEHRRVRQIAHRAFTPRRMAALQATMAADAEALLEPLSGQGTVDLLPFAYRMPLVVLMRMLGVPSEDRELIHGWSEQLAAQLGDIRGVEETRLRAANDAKQEFCRYLEQLVEERRRDPPPEGDLLLDLIGAQGDGRLSPEELTAMFVVLLLAGHETTTALIVNGLIELLRSGEWQRLCDDPRIAPDAVEELLRFVSPVLGNPQLSVCEVEIGGELIAPGATVLPLAAAANRDPRVFDDPERLDLGRANARSHLAFGFGEHYCIGNQLARQEAATSFAVLARRFPELELTGEPIEWHGTSMLRRPRSLPVSLGRDRGSAA